MLGWDEGNIVGVVGGLGPLATALFLQTVVERTVADSDQTHIDMLVSQHSSTPDRTAYLFDDTQADPIPVLRHDAALLERAGANFLVLPCNTAHAFQRQIEDAVDLEVVGILEATVDAVTARSEGPTRVALLATDGTRRAHLYQDALLDRGHDVVLPSDEDQHLIMDLIYRQVKAGDADNLAVLTDVIHRLSAAGAQYFVLGCTELSVAGRELGLLEDPRVVDSLRSLADATIRRAGRTIKEAPAGNALDLPGLLPTE